MLQQEMHEIAQNSLRKARVRLKHSVRKSTYQVIGYIKVDIDGAWHPYIQYMDVQTNETYARHDMNFKNFTLVK